METKTRTKMIETTETYFVAEDGTEFEIEAECLEYEKGLARKQKYPRINLAFYGENLEYVREAAHRHRVSITEYVNHLIQEDRIRRAATESSVSPIEAVDLFPHDETRTKRLQFLVKPSINEAVDQLVREKKIKSKNDLVNFLLENYLVQNKEQ